MARSVPDPLVVPSLTAVGRAPIVETTLQAVRGALVTLYEQQHGSLVGDYHPDGLTDGTAVSLYYLLQNQKPEAVGSVFPNLNVTIWATNAGAAPANVAIYIDGSSITSIAVPVSATITAYSETVEWDELGQTHSELELQAPAKVVVYGVSVYDERSRTTLDPGVYTSGVAIPDSATWDAEKPCSVAHYLDLVALARHLHGREAGTVLSACRQAATIAGTGAWTVRTPLPLSARVGGEVLTITWYAMGSAAVTLRTPDGASSPGIASSGYGTWDGPYTLSVYVPQDAVARPAFVDLSVVVAGDLYAIAAWWTTPPAVVPRVEPLYLITETPEYIVTETGARIRV